MTVCRRFGVRIFVGINRFDLAEDICGRIEEYCRKEEILAAGKIPFDPGVIEAARNGRPVTRSESPATDALRDLWNTLFSELGLT